MDFKDLRRQRPDEAPVAMYGKIAKAASDLSDLLPVVLPDYDEFLEWGPCRWQSRDDTSLPAKGDLCLVVFDNRRDPWIAVWWPF